MLLDSIAKGTKRISVQYELRRQILAQALEGAFTAVQNQGDQQPTEYPE